MATKPPLGSGERFKALKNKLAARTGAKAVRNPGALAAYSGRKKYGAKKFAGLAAKGRMRHMLAEHLESGRVKKAS